MISRTKRSIVARAVKRLARKNLFDVPRKVVLGVPVTLILMTTIAFAGLVKTMSRWASAALTTLRYYARLAYEEIRSCESNASSLPRPGGEIPTPTVRLRDSQRRFWSEPDSWG